MYTSSALHKAGCHPATPTLHCVTPVCPTRQRFGLALKPICGAPLRFALSLDAARDLHQSLGAYLALYACQSPRSSDMPSRDGSPQEGQKVAPMAMSSAAAAGLWYEPSPSSSNSASQRPFAASRIQKVPARVRWLNATACVMVLALSLRGWSSFHSRR